jgi:hypothetical protein
MNVNQSPASVIVNRILGVGDVTSPEVESKPASRFIVPTSKDAPLKLQRAYKQSQKTARAISPANRIIRKRART